MDRGRGERGDHVKKKELAVVGGPLCASQTRGDPECDRPPGKVNENGLGRHDRGKKGDRGSANLTCI